jgi:hypothetical protein
MINKEIRIGYSKDHKQFLWTVCDFYGDILDEGLSPDIREAFESALYIYEDDEI